MEYKNILSLLYDMCRICLNNEGDINIFGQLYLTKDIFETTGVTVCHQDNLPQMICNQCLDIINKAQALRKVAGRSEARLRSYRPKEPDSDTDFEPIAPPEVIIEVHPEPNEKNNLKRLGPSDDATPTEKELSHSEVSSSQLSQDNTLSDTETQGTTGKVKSKRKYPKISVRSDLYNGKDTEEITKETTESPIKPSKRKISGKKEKTVDDLSDRTCYTCNKVYGTKKLLYLHSRLHLKNIPCPICEKYFASKSDMTKHLRVHTGEKPFKCDVCERQFTQKGTLKSHKENVHTSKHFTN